MGAVADSYAILKHGSLWSSTGRCKGFAVANPGEAAKIDLYVTQLDAWAPAAAAPPARPVLATDTGNGIVRMLDAVAAKHAAPPPPPPPVPAPSPTTVSNSLAAGSTLTGSYAWKVETAGDCTAVEFWASSTAGNRQLGTVKGADTFTLQFDTAILADGVYKFGIVEVDSTGVRHIDEDRRDATVHNTVAPPPTPSAGALLALDYASGAIVKPTGKWDAVEISDSGSGSGVTVGPSLFPGWTRQGIYTLTAGSQTQPGWHDRAVSRMNRASLAVVPGMHLFYAFAVRFPASMNDDGFTAGRMVTEFIHNDNQAVNSMIAPLGIFIHTPSETWDGTRFVQLAPTNTPALVLRVCGGYVPGQQPGGNHVATNQSDWHPNILLASQIPVDTNLHFVTEVLYHEGAGAAPVGGGNVHDAPMFNGADPLLGSVRVWMAVTNQRPSATDFKKLIDLPAVRTLVYGDDGNGNHVGDNPYGPFGGLYDSADTISYKAQSVYPFYGVFTEYAAAIAALTA